VEFVSGSPHGLFVIVLSFLEGAFAELGFWPFQKYPRLAYMVSGALGAFASVFIAQVLFMISPDLYQGFASIYLFIAVSLLAAVSGVVFAGYFAGGILDSLADAGIVKRASKQEKKKSLLTFSVPKAFALVCLLLIVFSSIYYFGIVQAHTDPHTVKITGDVAYSGNEYYIPAYSSYYTTLYAKLDGEYTHKPARNYTGLPVTYVLKDARVKSSATKFDVVGSDGYYQTFNLTNVTTNDDLILTVQEEPDRIWLIAKNYAGGMWVDQVVAIRVY
jgi:energy-coupling factor transport system substrate-specific component